MLGILFVFIYHSTRFYNVEDWKIKNVIWYPSVEVWNIFATSFMMPLMFAISSASLFYALGKGGFGKFLLGYVLFADERITRAVRRDGWLLIGVGSIIIIGMVGAYVLGLPLLDWGQDTSSPQFYILLCLITPVALCYSVGLLFIGMCFLDFTDKWLQYGQEAALPFFVLHQPVIISIAFFVVQWNTGIWIKILIVVLSSFLVTIGLYELIVRRVRAFRLLFGMKARLLGSLQAGP